MLSLTPSPTIVNQYAPITLLVSGTSADLRLARGVLARIADGLRAGSRRLAVEFAEQSASPQDTLVRVRACDVFIGLYSRALYDQPLSPHHALDLSAQFAEAQKNDKPMLVFVQALKDDEPPDAQRIELITRVITPNFASTLEFASAEQLEDQLTQALTALIAARLNLRVTRPPFLAPPAVANFVGRASLVEKICAAIEPGRAVILHSAGYSGGQGKTTLAIQVAHRLREMFDGVLWASVPTMRPADTLATWARPFGGFAALGRGDLRFTFRPLDADTLILEDTRVRADALCEIVRDKRVLAILDGVETDTDMQTIAPLLTALRNSAVVVTSRAPLALANATAIEVGGLDEDAAITLFAQLVGDVRLNDARSRAANHPDDVRALIGGLVRMVDGSPLAVRLLAAQLRERTDLTLEMLVRMVRNERMGIADSNQQSDAGAGLRVAINLAFALLAPDEQKFLDVLGVFAGDDFDADAAAVVADTRAPIAGSLLEYLTRWALIEPGRGAGRYGLHRALKNFVRAHAPNPDAALSLARYYCDVAIENGRNLQSSASRAAMATLDREQANIFAAQAYARERRDTVGWQITRDFVDGAMTYYFSLRAMWSEWIAWSNAGIEACQQLGDEAGAGRIAGGLGMVYYRKNELGQAVEFCKYALALMEKIGNQPALATICMNLGNIQVDKGAWQDGLNSLFASLRIREQMGDLHGQAQTRANIGVLYAKHGDRAKARANWMQALEMFAHLDKNTEADIVRKWLKGLPPQ